MKKQNPIVIALAAVGVLALLYGGWALYQHHAAEEQNRAFFQGTPDPGVAGLYQPSKQPPPQ